MADIIESLWPTNLYTPPAETPPVVVLREQAALLGQQTKNMVEGEISTIDLGDGSLVHALEVHAMALNGYTYTLFYVEHGVGLYPATIHRSLAAAKAHAAPLATCGTEQEFKAKLREMFASEDTRNVISAMLAQS